MSRISRPPAGARKADCTELLQWALPQLGLSWTGFRKVRGQVCKRIRRRMQAVDDRSFAEYRSRLAADPAEWVVLECLCRVTISRFCRDRPVFDMLSSHVLPILAQQAQEEARDIRIWSAGCASGEEPYTLAVLWNLRTQPEPAIRLSIVGTDIDETVLGRARRACYTRGSLRELPRDLLNQAFQTVDGELCLREEHRQAVSFLRQDIRKDVPAGPFDLILCRNLAFTYFAPSLQARVLARMLGVLRSGGFLVIGDGEGLPSEAPDLVAMAGSRCIFVHDGIGTVHGSER